MKFKKENIPWNKGKKGSCKPVINFHDLPLEERVKRSSNKYHIWTPEEEAVLTEVYPLGGVNSVKQKLPYLKFD